MRAILTYHSLDDSGSVISLAPAQFERHLEWLERGNVAVRPLADVVSAADDPNGRDVVALTFDDGFSNFDSVAAPMLRARGLPATVFVVSSRVGIDNRWSDMPAPGIPVLPLMGWDRLGALADEGFEIGAHTKSHPKLPSLGSAQLEDEIAGGADDIAGHLGRRPQSFAYPYGALDARAAVVAAREFTVSCTTDFRAIEPGDTAERAPRLDSFYFRTPGQLDRWGSLAFRSRIRVRGSLRQLRGLMRRIP